MREIYHVFLGFIRFKNSIFLLFVACFLFPSGCRKLDSENHLIRKFLEDEQIDASSAFDLADQYCDEKLAQSITTTDVKYAEANRTEAIRARYSFALLKALCSGTYEHRNFLMDVHKKFVRDNVKIFERFQLEQGGTIQPLLIEKIEQKLLRQQMEFMIAEPENQIAFWEMRNFSLPFAEPETIRLNTDKLRDDFFPEIISLENGYYENDNLYTNGFSLRCLLQPASCRRRYDVYNKWHIGNLEVEFREFTIIFEIIWKNGVFDSKKQLLPPEQP